MTGFRLLLSIVLLVVGLALIAMAFSRYDDWNEQDDWFDRDDHEFEFLEDSYED